MKQYKQATIDALDSNYAALENSTTADLVVALGEVAETGCDGDLETLYAMDAILCELDLRNDINPSDRRWLTRQHRGILEQI